MIILQRVGFFYPVKHSEILGTIPTPAAATRFPIRSAGSLPRSVPTLTNFQPTQVTAHLTQLRQVPVLPGVISKALRKHF